MSSQKTKKQPAREEASADEAPQVRLPLWKKLAFSLLALVVFFGLIESVLFLVRVKPLSYEEDPYVGFSSRIPLYEEEGEKLTTARNKLSFFNRQSFPKEKPSDTTRIFCVGGSTTYGRPYDDTTSFCGWLRELLPVADSSQDWELINAGGISYASYRVSALMEELSEYDPDIFVVYCGQNEFLERRTYAGIIEMPEAVRGLGATLSRTRTFSGLSRLIRGSGKRDEGGETLGGEVNAILDQSFGPEQYERDEEFEGQVLDHYRFNMARIVDIARAAGAKVIFVTPASNLSHCSPFKSQHRDGLGEEELAQWSGLIEMAREGRNAENYETALKKVDEALAMDDRYAEAHYLRGKILEGLKRFPEAKESYQRALDEDVCPLRALSPMPEIVKEVAEDREVPMIDFVAMVEEASPHGIPGESLFLDHVHPTIEGHQLLAVSLVELMKELDWLSKDGGLSDEKIAEVSAKVMKKVDPKKQGVAMRNLSKVFSWAGKMEDAYAAAKKALELFPGDAEAHYQVGNLAYALGRKDEAVERLSYLVSVPLSASVDYYVKAHAQLADILAEQGEHEKSAQILQKLLVLDPDHPAGEKVQVAAQFGQAKALLKEGKLPEAVAMLKNVLKEQPDHFEAQLQLSVAYVRGGDFESAVPAIESLIEARPNYLPAYDNLSYVLAQLNRLDEAEKLCLKALEIDPNHEAAKKNLRLIRSKKESGD